MGAAQYQPRVAPPPQRPYLCELQSAYVCCATSDKLYSVPRKTGVGSPGTHATPIRQSRRIREKQREKAVGANTVISFETATRRASRADDQDTGSTSSKAYRVGQGSSGLLEIGRGAASHRRQQESTAAETPPAKRQRTTRADRQSRVVASFTEEAPGVRGAHAAAMDCTQTSRHATDDGGSTGTRASASAKTRDGGEVINRNGGVSLLALSAEAGSDEVAAEEPLVFCEGAGTSGDPDAERAHGGGSSVAGDSLMYVDVENDSSVSSQGCGSSDESNESESGDSADSSGEGNSSEDSAESDRNGSRKSSQAFAERALFEAGLGNMARIRNAQRLRPLMAALRGHGGETQMVALQELAEQLSIGTEETLLGLDVGELARELVRVLGSSSSSSSSANAMLLACRCLANVLEALPLAGASVVRHGAVEALCARLLDIEYIDVAEQALATLAQLSGDFGAHVCRAGGMRASLMFLDFFATTTQRTALTCAANCARAIGADQFTQAVDVVPVLEHTVLGADPKSAELACSALLHVVCAFRATPGRVEQLVSPELLQRVVAAIRPGGVAAQNHSCILLLRVLAAVAGASRTRAAQLLRMQLLPVLADMLTSACTGPESASGSSARPFASALQVSERPWETLRLIVALLPRLPTTPEQCALGEDLVRASSSDAVSSDGSTALPSAQPSDCELALCLQAVYTSPDVLDQLQRTLVPLMMRIFATTINVSARYRALLVILKASFYLDADRLRKTLNDINLPQFVAGALSHLEAPLLSAVLLLIVRVVLEKLPSYCTLYFSREGVFAGLARLALEAEGVLAVPPAEDAMNSTHIASGFKLIGYHIPASARSGAIAESLRSSPSAEAASVARGCDDEPLVRFVALQARALLQSIHCTSEDVSNESEHSAMQPLRLLAERLGEPGCSDESVRFCFQALAERLVSPKSATCHELIQSGLVQAVAQTLARTRTSCQALVVDVVQCLLQCHAPGRPNSPATSALGILLSRLQDALGIAEQLCVREAFQSAADASRSPARMLSRQIRFAVCPASVGAAARMATANPDLNSSDETYSSSTMKLVRRSFEPIRLGVHAVATFGVLETYLRPRIALLVRSARERGRRRRRAQQAIASTSDSGPFSTSPVASPPRRTQLESVAIDPASTASLDSSKRSTPRRERDHLRMLQAIARASGIDLRAVGLLEGLASDNSAGPSDGDEDSADEGPSAAALVNSANASITDSSTSQVSDANGHGSIASYDSVSDEQDDWHITFLLRIGANEKVVSSSDNIFRAVYDLCQRDAELKRANTWAQSFELQFVVDSGPRQQPPCDMLPDHQSRSSGSCFTDSCNRLEASIGEQAVVIVRLLRLLYDLLPQATSSVPPHSCYCLEDFGSQFVNRQIAAKTARQLDDPLMVVCSALPDWCRHLIAAAPFLVPFELRVAFMQATCFGYSRNINHWQAIARRELHGTSHSPPDLQIPLGHVQRQKVRISRHRMLESALKVIELYGSPKSVLEVEYFDEVGSGIGPTLEFYASVSRCLQERGTGLWRNGDFSPLEGDPSCQATLPPTAKYVNTLHRLYPACLDSDKLSVKSASGMTSNPQQSELSLHTTTTSLPLADRTIQMFKFVGHFVAKALIDSRILDIPLSSVFWAAVHRHLQISHGADTEFVWSWLQLEALDPELTRSLRYMHQFVDATRAVYAREDLSPTQIQVAIDSIRHPNDQASIVDLALDFTLPGRPDIELRPGGTEIPVTIKNIHSYIDLVVKWTLYTGVRAQVAAFCEGFDQVFPSRNLLMFTPGELCCLVGQELDSSAHWSMDELVDTIKADHGFSLSSSEVQMFLKFLTSLDSAERRMLLQFATGSPRLPLGGFRSLQPPLTLVPRPSFPPLKPDDYLPSVMTCANFIKLPRYSSFDVLAQRWRQAMSEGQQSFHLS
ncbi:Ubiquitin fusion degradation protein 4 [Coemansia sp. RSA 988]|nr:Ubiquitin fusion degradation protein 4 [Coemansia sp. RSA 988]